MPRRRQCVIFDVDGTLADVSGVRHYVMSDPRRKDFEAFHAAASFSPPHDHVLAAVRREREAGRAIIVVTSRKERWRYRTSMWLRKWEVDHDHLMMRPDSDGRKDVDVKRDILARIRTRYDVVHAYDDNPSVIALWHDEGILTTVVAGWIEEESS